MVGRTVGYSVASVANVHWPRRRYSSYILMFSNITSALQISASAPCHQTLPFLQVRKPHRAEHADIVRAAASLESIFRSCNNLLERLHHSYFMYLQPSTEEFITVDVYVVPPVLLIAALILWAAHILIVPPPKSRNMRSFFTAPSSKVSDAQTLIGTPVATSERTEGGDTHEAPFVWSKCWKAWERVRLRKSQKSSVFGSEPLKVLVGLGQFERCCSAVLALYVASGVVGMGLHLAADRSTLDHSTSLNALLLLGSLAGALCMLARPWLPLWLGSREPAASFQANQGSRTSTKDTESSLPEGGAVLRDWQVIKAVGLITIAAIMAGSLFLNWCAVFAGVLVAAEQFGCAIS